MDEFLKRMQTHIAETSIGSSTLRNQGDGGVVKAARAYLTIIDLRKFGASTALTFPDVLEVETELLRRSLPDAAQHWGAARKAVNIFLRNSLYNRYLFDYYRLAHLEGILEIPLDRDVATKILEVSEARIPNWTTIKSLTKETSDLYQREALRFAQSKGTCRVHLDLFWWRAKAD